MLMLTPYPRRNAAFTLAELLLVGVLVVIIAAIALPVFGQMQQKSKDVKCLNNLKRVGQGCFLYAADNNGKLPFEYRDPEWQGGGTDRFWYISVARYLEVPIKNAALGELENPGPFACPADKIPWVAGGFQVFRPSCSYAYPIHLTPSRLRPDLPVALRLPAIPHTTKTVMLVDSVFGNVFNPPRLTTEDKAANDPNETMSKLQERHNGLNAVFLDGHCEHLPSPVSGSNPSADFKLWGPVIFGVDADM